MKLVLLFLSNLFLFACATTPSSDMQLQQYLNRYVGQSSQQIMQDFDLSALGYAPAQLVKHNPEHLIYSIPRPVNIPIPIPQAPNSVSEAFQITAHSNIQQHCPVRFYFTWKMTSWRRLSLANVPAKPLFRP